MKTNFNEYQRKRDDELVMFNDWKDSPSDENTKKILDHLQPTINTALMSFTGGDKNLKIRSYILAKKALISYDPNKGASLKTHVYNNLKRLQRFKAERSQVVHIPENVRLDALQINRFAGEFKDKNNREPAIAEIQDGVGLSPRRIRKASLYGSEQPTSKFVGETGDSLISTKRTPQDIWRDYVYYDLDPVNKKIFEWTTGYQGSATISKKKIASNLGITSAAVSSRINTIMKKLQEGV